MGYRVRTPDGELSYGSMREVELAYTQGLVGPEDEVLEEVRRRRPEVPMVMLTGDSTVQDRAEDLGVTGFLRKPFDVADLIDILARVEPSLDLREVGAADIDVRDVDTPWFGGR